MNSHKTQAATLKQKANQLFHHNQLHQALKLYTKAIQLDPFNSLLFSNRARCQKNLNQLMEANEDANRALQLDPKNIKAQLLTGQILLDVAITQKDSHKVILAIDKLKKSLSMSSGNKLFQVTLQEKIYRARKNLWQITRQKQVSKKKLLKSFMIKLIEGDGRLDDDKKDLYQQKIVDMLDLNIRTEKSRIPEQLICEVSRQIMKDPVCNQYGYTYCRKPYLQYVKIHNMDPKTKKQLKNANQVYSNISIRKAIDQFLQRDIWAYEEKV